MFFHIQEICLWSSVEQGFSDRKAGPVLLYCILYFKQPLYVSWVFGSEAERGFDRISVPVFVPYRMLPR